jgi:hypothetical protein
MRYVGACRGAPCATVGHALQQGLPQVLARRVDARAVIPGARLTHHHGQRALLSLQLPGHPDVQVGDDGQRQNVPATRRVVAVSVCYISWRTGSGCCQCVLQ